ncbi:MAG: hypothetical protein ACKO2P_03335 [Planctomycetota bacterium]
MSHSEPESAASGRTVDEHTPLQTLLNGILYSASLPERIVRSAVGLTAGTAKELAEFIVPQAFQTSKSYEVAIRNSLNFLLSAVGDVGGSSAAGATGGSDPSATSGTSSAASADAAAPTADTGRFVAKKAIANFIDITGLTTLHVSPLWILAIVSDAAYGTRIYLEELATELQRQGLIDDSSTIHRVEDLFAAVQKASGRAASAFDLPPLSLAELKESVTQTRKALNEIDPSVLIPETEIRRLWQEMKDLAVSENVSLLGVSGALAMHTVEAIREATQGTLAGLFVAGRIINRNLFAHYAASLQHVRTQGLVASLKNTFEPYTEMAWNNFSASHRTWTETVLNPGWAARLWRWFKGRFGR